jgi:hypothetical protein
MADAILPQFMVIKDSSYGSSLLQYWCGSQDASLINDGLDLSTLLSQIPSWGA